MISEISVEELEDIAYGSSVNWRRVDSYLGDERRWGHDRWIVFCDMAANDVLVGENCEQP